MKATLASGLELSKNSFKLHRLISKILAVKQSTPKKAIVPGIASTNIAIVLCMCRAKPIVIVCIPRHTTTSP